MPSVPHNPQAHHRSHRQSVLREAWVAGSCASVLSALALGWAGHREVRSAAAPLNAVSHWRWGRRALFQRGISGHHTLLGFFIHHCASVWWAGLHAAVRGRSPRAQQPAVVLAGAAATSAIACVVDFQYTPERLTPGFEHHLSRRALAGVYAMFALGLAAGALAVRRSAARAAAGLQDRSHGL